MHTQMIGHYIRLTDYNKKHTASAVDRIYYVKLWKTLCLIFPRFKKIDEHYLREVCLLQ